MEEVNLPVIEYIPQRPPMVMIDALTYADESSAHTTLNISPNNIFVESGAFREPGLIENIAQTAAAMVGYQCKVQNKPVPVGFIAAIKNWKLNAIPPIHSTIETTVKVVNSVMDISIVEGTVKQEGLELCSCEMRILVQKNTGS